jgi:hypothetical protein
VIINSVIPAPRPPKPLAKEGRQGSALPIFMPEKPLSQNPSEHPPLTQEQCRQIAEEIYGRYEKELLEHQEEPVDGDKGWYANNRGVIENHLARFSPEVLHEYWGHGVTRGNKLDRLTAAVSILSDGAMKGDSAPLAASGYVNAYTDGDFLAISRQGKQLMEYGEDRRPIFISLGENEYTGREIKAVKINPGALVVNAYFYPIVEELRSRFPQANILYANELPEYIEGEEAEK